MSQIKNKQKFLSWFHNLPIRQKQLLGLFTSEVISVVGLVGVGAYLIITGGRQQLLEQAKSEIAVNQIEYDIKINQMGFGFRGQSDNAAIIAAAQSHVNQGLLSSSLEQQVRQILQNEIQARNIEYATLVGQDLRIIVNANIDREGEVFNPNNLVREVLATAEQIKTSERLDWLDLMQESPPLPSGTIEQDILIRYTATPVNDPETQEVIGVLISGDIVNSKPDIVQETVETLNGGYSGIYLQRSSGDFMEVEAFLVDSSSASINSSKISNKILEVAVANSGEVVTGRERIGTQTYTLAAKAILNYAGEPIAVLVRGTSENSLNALLNQSLSIQLIITILALGVDIGLAVLLSFAMIRPIQRLKKTAQQFAAGDLQARAEVLSTDEVGQLTATFNDMADNLSEKNSKLKTQAEKQKRLNARLSQEVTERQEAEAALQKSEAELREKNQILEQMLPQLQATQDQVIQSEKISSLGQLVGGIAYEIDNPISYINGNLSYLQKYSQNLLNFIQLYQKYYPNPDQAIQAQAEEIDLPFIKEDLLRILASMQLGTERIHDIVRSLRNFSQMDEAEFKPMSIHEALNNTLLILQHRLKDKPQQPDIQVIKNYGNLPLVDCYAGLLNQVFMNILTNAIDALEEVKIQSSDDRQVQKNPPQIKIKTSVTQSEFVKIAIADNGVGIPQDIQQQIFDPFFTTKPIGKGTGMGMAISYQIITEKYHGKLECFSKRGKGTIFVIKIPVRQQINDALTVKS
ncbi:MAG: ATP-binding protein [Cyanobacteriota bacterium]|nr:ATP-binding protein [Cyanobacteriota bacterium]